MLFNLQMLRYERLSRKVSQDQIAKALNMNRSSYNKKENGINKMSVEEFAVILKELDIPHIEAGKFFAQIVPERELIVVLQE